ncbi:MAG: nicotinate-nucleotide adenylyltransferase [Lacipirellulaceae bacterium]
MRIGLFGGSFDPVHNGHLRLAACCRDQSRLHEVWLVPAAVQPHKPGGPVASDADRVAMLRLAVDGLAGLKVLTLEIDRGGVSYTIDTLRAVQHERPDAELFFVMGADTLHDLPDWREPRAVLALATPLVAHRPGEPPPDFAKLGGLVDAARLAAFREHLVEMPATELSSSEVRRRLAAGEAVEGMLPPPVVELAQRVYGARVRG